MATTTIQEASQIVEDAIRQLGIDATAARGKKDGEWTLYNGNFIVWMDVFEQDTDGRIYFQVLAPAMQLTDAAPASFLREVLAVNNVLYGISFSIYQDHLMLKGIREATDLDVSEAFALIAHAGNVLAQYVPYFVGLLRGGTPPKA